MRHRVKLNSLRTRLLGAAAGLALAAAPIAASAADMVEGSDWLRRWDGVKLTLSSHTGPTTDAVKAISAKFAELTGAEVEVIDESWTDLLSKHLADAAAGGGTYDILTWPYIWTGHYVEGGLVEDLNGWFAMADLADPRFDLDDIPEAVLEVYGRYRGSASPNPDGLWSVPYKFDVYLAQYRTDLYEQAGIVDADGKAKPPETWAELLDNAKVLKEKFPDMQPVVFPLAVDDPMVATFLPMIAAYGGTIPIPWYDGNLYPEFQNAPGQEAIAILQELTEYMPADVLDMDYDRVNAHMAQGPRRLRAQLERVPPGPAGPGLLADPRVGRVRRHPGRARGAVQRPRRLADGGLVAVREQGGGVPAPRVDRGPRARRRPRPRRGLGRPPLGRQRPEGGGGVPLLPAAHGRAEGLRGPRHGPLVGGAPAHHRRRPQQDPARAGCDGGAERDRRPGLRPGRARRVLPLDDRRPPVDRAKPGHASPTRPLRTTRRRSDERWVRQPGNPPGRAAPRCWSGYGAGRIRSFSLRRPSWCCSCSPSTRSSTWCGSACTSGRSSPPFPASSSAPTPTPTSFATASSGTRSGSPPSTWA